MDYRHAYLVADNMTSQGYINPMSRMGLKYNKSSMLKMSFETTMQFLVESTKGLEVDQLNSASSCLVVGNPTKIGSGAFEVREKVKCLVKVPLKDSL